MFHHVLGRTSGMEALAGRFREAGHTVHLPDLFEGRVFDDREDGSAYAQSVGFDTLIERGRLAAEALPRELVYAGVSLGVLPAQLLAQTRLGARAALLVSAAVEPSEFDAPWPEGVPLQVHAKEGDTMFAEEGHLFTEAGGEDHDPTATDLFVERATGLLSRL